MANGAGLAAAGAAAANAQQVIDAAASWPWDTLVAEAMIGLGIP
jgi:hypothetical protein